MGGLNEYFDAVVAKVLTAVEVDKLISNQHEINGVGALRKFFGTHGSPRHIEVTYFDMEEAILSPKIVELTWYDARLRHPTRTEWRLYYPPTIASRIQVGSLLVLARRGEKCFVFTGNARSIAGRNLARLFDLNLADEQYQSKADSQDESVLAASSQLVLAELGIGRSFESTVEQQLFSRFPGDFPSGQVFSEFARSVTFGVDPRRDPDEALLAWMRTELELFTLLETRIEEIAMTSAASLDDKLAIAMRVFQRRRSRAGKAFEYHLRAIFVANDVTYDANPVTERREEPDFVFPGIAEYRDPTRSPQGLVMLAAKQTLRDRWRQVLNEADRIARKHLVTIDINVSRNQIEEIQLAGIQLVVPRELHLEYPDDLANSFLTVKQFVELVRFL